MAIEFERLQEEDYTSLILAELELLAVLLEEDIIYPWEPSVTDSEAYFAELEASLPELPEQEILARAPGFYAQLDELWAQLPQADTTANAKIGGGSLADCLQQRFAAYVPPESLTAIAHFATASCQADLADRLVHCVQQLLPSWSSEDLLVLARPFAYAMRSTDQEITEFVLQNIARSHDWNNLSAIEQATATLAIARYALDQVAEIQCHTLEQQEISL